MSSMPTRLLSPEEYLTQERLAGFRSEYYWPGSKHGHKCAGELAAGNRGPEPHGFVANDSSCPWNSLDADACAEESFAMKSDAPGHLIIREA